MGQKMMHDLQQFKSKGLNPKVKLDDLVYFQSMLSNYVVMAANADELQSKFNIFKNPSINDINKLVDRSNIINDNLEKLVKQVTEDWQIPHDYENGMMVRGINQMSIFEFMNLYYSADDDSRKVKMIKPLPDARTSDCVAAETKANTQYVVEIGDALWAPFWPDGTGMSRGILSVLHAGFTLHHIWKNAKTDSDRKNFLEQGDLWAKLGANAQGSDCKGGKCSPAKLKEYVLKGYANQGMPKYFADWM